MKTSNKIIACNYTNMRICNDSLISNCYIYRLNSTEIEYIQIH